MVRRPAALAGMMSLSGLATPNCPEVAIASTGSSNASSRAAARVVWLQAMPNASLDDLAAAVESAGQLRLHSRYVMLAQTLPSRLADLASAVLHARGDQQWAAPGFNELHRTQGQLKLAVTYLETPGSRRCRSTDALRALNQAGSHASTAAKNAMSLPKP
jgi:hypothetical protein